jgi:hypothetical protein
MKKSTRAGYIHAYARVEDLNLKMHRDCLLGFTQEAE